MEKKVNPKETMEMPMLYKQRTSDKSKSHQNKPNQAPGLPECIPEILLFCL